MLEAALRLLARLFYERSRLKLEEAFVDATLASAKNGHCCRPQPGTRKYDEGTIHGPFRKAQQFLNFKPQQRTRLPR